MATKKESKTTALQVLARLRKSVETMPDYELKRLWNILTALRGPDDKDLGVKHATTSVIRTAVFGIDSPFAKYADFNHDDKAAVKARESMVYDHFKSHAISAFNALGLEWDKNNLA